MKTIDHNRACKQIAEEILKRLDRLTCDLLNSIVSNEDISFEDRLELIEAVPYMTEDVTSKLHFNIDYYGELIEKENEENKEE